MRLLSVGLISLLLLALVACSATPPTYRHTYTAFGSVVELTLVGVPEIRAAAAATQVAEDFAMLHDAWHAWQPGSLGRVNTLLASSGRFAAPPAVLPLITRSQTLALQSDNLFNPALGKLFALWGFHKDDPSHNAPPDPAAVAALLAARPQMQDIVVDGLFLQTANPAVQLDFGAIAKGYATDLALDRLRAQGVQHALINAGGSVKAMGQNGTQPWRVGIRDPHQAQQALAWLEVQGTEAVVTSGSYERFFSYQGQRYSHIIDPRTGQPATGVLAVTVVHPEGATADAAATALFLAGVKDFARIARQMGITQALLLDAAGQIYLTPALAQRLQFTPPTPPMHLIELSS